MAVIQIRVRLKFMTLMTLNMTLNMTLCGQCSWAYDACDASSLTHAHTHARTVILLSVISVISVINNISH